MPTSTLTAEQEELVRRFPAKFSKLILEAGVEELSARMLQTANILDPFGGVGGVHKLADILPVTTVAVDIEKEQAALHLRTIHGDSKNLVKLLPRIAKMYGSPDARPNVIFTSAAYGNRFSDAYLGSDQETCGKCKGRCWVPKDGVTLDPGTPISASTVRTYNRVECGNCGGTGKAASSRQGYAIALGRLLTPGSGAALHWGGKYRSLHRAVIRASAEVLDDGGWWMVNVSSSLATKDGAEVYNGVMEWWVEEIAKVARVEKLRAIQTPRSRHGQNHEKRVPVEHLIIARAV